MRISDWSSDVCSSDLRSGGETGTDELLRYPPESSCVGHVPDGRPLLILPSGRACRGTSGSIELVAPRCGVGGRSQRGKCRAVDGSGDADVRQGADQPAFARPPFPAPAGLGGQGVGRGDLTVGEVAGDPTTLRGTLLGTAAG